MELTLYTRFLAVPICWRSGFWMPTRIRVVWVIFDELSQAIVFDQRPPNLACPNFDREIPPKPPCPA
jgi:hypothetical protein